MKTAILIGAGFSEEFGCPLAWGITKELKNFLTPNKLIALNSKWGEELNDFDKSVIDFTVQLLNDNRLHYESILGSVQARYNQINIQYRQDYYGAYLWLTEIIYWILYLYHIKNPLYIKESVKFYEGLKNLANNNKPLWIFSLNHDLLVEMLADEFNLPISSGFSSEHISLPLRDLNGIKLGQQEFSFLSRQDLDKNNFNFIPFGSEGINLLKIHGSLDIFGYKDELNYIKIIPNGKGIDGWTRTLETVNTNLVWILDGRKIKCTNEIAVEDETNTAQFLRRTLLAGAFKFDKRISQNAPPEILEFFKSQINYFDKLIIIGYSFIDYHINKIIMNWMEFTNERKLTIVDPIRKQKPDGFMHLSPQIQMINMTTTDFLDFQGSIPNTLSRKLYKRLRKYIRKKQQ